MDGAQALLNINDLNRKEHNMKRKPTLAPGGPKGAPRIGSMPKLNNKHVVPGVPTAKTTGAKTRVTPVPTAWKPLLPARYFKGE
jgi:hypothetical protein